MKSVRYHKLETVQTYATALHSLVEEHPAVGLLDGLTVINHRLGIVKGFVEMHKDGWLVAGIAGLTNTFRFKHRKPLVNLPAVGQTVRQGDTWAAHCT